MVSAAHCHLPWSQSIWSQLLGVPVGVPLPPPPPPQPKAGNSRARRVQIRLSRLYRERLKTPEKALRHVESALASDASDPAALRELSLVHEELETPARGHRAVPEFGLVETGPDLLDGGIGWIQGFILLPPVGCAVLY